MNYRILFLVMIFGLFGVFKMYQSQTSYAAPDLKGKCELTKYESTDEQMHLIELYTSEGCSSCPPADKWVNTLYNHKSLFKKFIALKFHVDYWDYIGWRDPLSNKNYSQRQRYYSSQWKSSSVYTPGFVMDGNEWRTWHFKSLPAKMGKPVGKLTVEHVGKNKFKLTFNEKNNSKNGRIASVAVLGNGIKHDIKRGENRGKKFDHFLSVVNFERHKLIRNGYISEGTFELGKPSSAASEYSLAVWIEDENQQGPIQTVGGCLPKDFLKI